MSTVFLFQFFTFRKIFDPGQKIIDSRLFPTIINAEGLSCNSEKEIWTEDQKQRLLEMLETDGAIIIRNLSFHNDEHLDEFTMSFHLQPYPLNKYTLAVRKHIHGNVYTANEMKVDMDLPLHHEMTQAPVQPITVFFHCKLKAVTGGNTPLANSLSVFTQMQQREPDFVDKLVRHGVRYINRAHREDDVHGSGVGSGWHSLLNTTDKDQAVIKAVHMGFQVNWLPGDVLKMTSPRIQAFRRYEANDRFAWYNKIYTWNVLALRNDTSGLDVVFGNDEVIPDDCLNSLQEVTEKETVTVDWVEGDLLVMDNRQVMHGKEAGTGARKIHVAMFT